MAKKSFFSELRRRKVFQSAAIYGAVAWGVTEVAVTVVEQLFLPQWVATLAVIGFVVGFPIAMFLSWTFDFTAQGIQRTEITSRRGTASIAASMVLLVAGTAGLFLLIRPPPATEIQIIPPNSVAVLPFSDAGVPPDHAYLIGGLSDELRDQLARVTGVRIAARSSSIAAARRGVDAASMSELLGVAKLVEGTVRRHGNVIRVSVHLVEGSNGLAIWSRTFERGPQELLNVQQEIAEAVVRHVLPEAINIVTEPATRIPSANEYLLRARHLELAVRERVDVDQASLLEAIRLYRNATEADPGSAIAFSRLAGALIYLGDLDSAEAPIFQALSLAPKLSEVQITRGEFHWARGEIGEAGVAWKRAVALNPENPEALHSLANWRWYQVETEGVAELYRRALELDPLNLERLGALGNYLAYENHLEEARALVLRMEELTDGAAAYRVIADTLEALGDVDQAIAWTIRARDLEPDNPLHVARLAEYYADIGDFKTALELDPDGIGILFKMRSYPEVIELAEFAMIDMPEDMRLRVILAVSHLAVGNYEAAIHVLQTSGLPDSVFNGWRSMAEYEGYIALHNALFEIGEVKMAQDLARWSLEQVGYTESNTWWGALFGACEWAVLGRGQEVREALRRAQLGRLLAWEPYLHDWPCFKRFRDDPVYVETIRHFDSLRAQLRERLPATLAEFGVKL